MGQINVRKSLAMLDRNASQVVVGETDGSLFKVAKGVGELEWHRHGDEDDLFEAPCGVEHRPVAQSEAEFLIVGPGLTSNAANRRTQA